jgi:hypothetical protein
MGTELTYSGARRRWEGEDVESCTFIWMDDATFQRYAWAYLDAQRIYQPLLGDVEHARQHCRQWEYWQGCTDPAVHWITLGKESKIPDALSS